MNSGGPPSRNAQQIAAERSGATLRRSDLHRPDPTAPRHVMHHRPFDHLDITGQVACRLRHRVAAVDDGHDAATCLGKIRRGAIDRIVVAKEYRPLPGQRGIAVGVGLNGRGQHHPGAVIVREYQQPFDGPGCDDHLFGPHPPVAFQHGGMIGVALIDAQQVVFTVGPDRALLQMDHIGQLRQLRNRCGHPVHRGRTIDFQRTSKQRAACLRALIRNEHPFAAAPGLKCRLQPGWPGPRNQHITMGITGFEMAPRRWCLRCPGQTGRAADGRLKQMPVRPLERLVVKSRPG